MDINTDFFKVLPPEIWATIFQYLHPKTEVAPLRLVSSHLKELVDHHQIYNVKMDGRVPNKIPPPHVKLGSIKLGNFLYPLQLPKYHRLNCLKNLEFKGPCHPYVVQKLLNESPQLQTLDIHGSALRVQTASYLIPTLLPEHNRIENLLLHKSTKLRYETATPREIVEGHLVCTRFIRMLSRGILTASVNLPVLTRFHLTYMDMPIVELYNLLSSTILPFLVRHSGSLKSLSLTLLPPVKNDSPTPLKIFLPNGEEVAQGNKETNYEQERGNVQQIKTSFCNLKVLHLRLPETALNCTLIYLYIVNDIENPILSNTTIQGGHLLENLVCIYEQPFQSTKQEEEFAFSVLQELIYCNHESLTVLQLENLNANHVLLCDYAKFSRKCTFKYLQKLSLSGRPRPRLTPQVQNMINNHDDNANGDIIRAIIDDNVVQFQMFQSKVLQHNFPVLKKLYLANVGLKSEALFIMIKQCKYLTKLKLTNNVYYKSLKINCSFLSEIVKKRLIQKIVIGSTDLCLPFQHAFWTPFKQRIQLNYSYEYEDRVGLCITRV